MIIVGHFLTSGYKRDSNEGGWTFVGRAGINSKVSEGRPNIVATVGTYCAALIWAPSAHSRHCPVACGFAGFCNL